MYEKLTNLTYQQAKNYYTHHPYGRKIVDFLVDMANLERNITFGKFPDAMGLFDDLVNHTDQHEAIVEACKLALIYGESTLYILIESQNETLSNISEPLLYHEIKPSDKVRFSAVSPIQASSPTEQDPLNINFLKKTEITINNKYVHPSRAIVLRNGIPLFLAFTDSAFQFSGRSIYQNSKNTLDTLLLLDIAKQRITSQTGLMIRTCTSQGSAGEEVLGDDTNQNIIVAKATMTNISTTNNTLAIPEGDKVEYLASNDAAQAVLTLRDALLKELAASTGIPYQEFTGESYSSSLSEGSSEFKVLNQKLGNIQNTLLKKAYSFTDNILLNILGNVLPKKEKKNTEAIKKSFVWNWGEFSKPEAGALLEADKLVAELNKLALDISGDKQTFIDNINNLTSLKSDYKLQDNKDNILPQNEHID